MGQRYCRGWMLHSRHPWDVAELASGLVFLGKVEEQEVSCMAFSPCCPPRKDFLRLCDITCACFAFHWSCLMLVWWHKSYFQLLLSLVAIFSIFVFFSGFHLCMSVGVLAWSIKNSLEIWGKAAFPKENFHIALLHVLWSKACLGNVL